MKDVSQIASLEVCVTVMYSLSVVDKETISCRLAAQETAPLCNKKAYPACLSSAMLSSASAKPFNSFVLPPYVSLYSFVP